MILLKFFKSTMNILSTTIEGICIYHSTLHPGIDEREPLSKKRIQGY